MNRLFKSKTLHAVVAIPLGAFVLGLLFWSLADADPMWAVVSFVLVYDPDMKVALSVGLWRLAHTVLGTAIALGGITLFGLHRWVMLVCLAVAAFFCGCFLHFRNSWRTVLVTVALVVGATLLAPGKGLHIALLRAVEVMAGSLLGIVFSWIVARLDAR